MNTPPFSSAAHRVEALPPRTSERGAIFPGNVLLCVNEFEQATFFPTALFDQLLVVAPQLRILRPTEAGTADLKRCLDELKPQVLIGAWSTPRLPEQRPESLEYLCFLCGSVKKIIDRRHLENGLRMTNWGGAISRPVAEAALLHVLACLRRVPHWTIAMHQQGAWRTPEMEGTSLFGLRVGIHGFGRVCRAFMRLLEPFEVKIKVFAPDADAAAGEVHGFEPVATLEELFAGSDVVVDLAPLIPETTGVVQEKHLRLLPPGGVFVNVGRGAVVDEPGLVRVAREGSLRIGLDVFATEPLAPDHPLRGLPNVFLTPHIAGPTANSCGAIGAFALANLRRFAAGEELEAVITPETYDRST